MAAPTRVQASFTNEQSSDDNIDQRSSSLEDGLCNALQEVESYQQRLESDRQRLESDCNWIQSMRDELLRCLSEEEKAKAKPEPTSASESLDTSSQSLHEAFQPSQFKQRLLSNVSNPWAITNIQEFEDIKDDQIFIARYKQPETFYTLLVSRYVFAFSESTIDDDDNIYDTRDDNNIYDTRDDGIVYCHLRRGECFFTVSKSDDEQAQWVQDEEQSDTFLAIGWLVERNKQGFHRTTGYVCALNLSTNPWSFWLKDWPAKAEDAGDVVPTLEIFGSAKTL